MDEPFGALDELTRMEMQDLLLDIRAKTGATVMFVTHSISEAVYLSDEVAGVLQAAGRDRRLSSASTCPIRARRKCATRAEFTALEHRAGRALGITR